MPPLLFDENLSPRLPLLVAELFPGSVHVREVGLARSDDSIVWDYARSRALAIVTKDDDFRQRSFLFGAPPKVIWVHLGNCSTEDVRAMLVERAASVRAFLADPGTSLLVLQRAEPHRG